MKEEISVSSNIFVYGILVTLFAVIVAAGALLVFATNSIREERNVRIQLKDSLIKINACQIASSQLAGRVTTFESLFLRTQMTAIEASLREFTHHMGGSEDEITLDEYTKWIKNQ